MGKGNFRPPQNRHPSTDHQQICHRWLRRRPLRLRLCQIRCISVHGGLLGTWVKYNQNYFYLYLFRGTHLHVRRVDGFSRMMAQTTRTRTRMCLFGNFFSYYSPFRGSKKPKTPQFWCVNRRLQAKVAKSKNVHIIKTTASIPTKFHTVIKTTKCPSWMVPTHVLQIQDGGRPPSGKNRKIVISQPRLTDFDQIWRGEACRTSWPY